MSKRLYLQLKNSELYYELCEIGIMVIGRDPGCDITLNYPDVSRKHCQLMVSTQGEFVEITDLDSRNGILLNKKLSNEGILHINDSLHIGNIIMTLVKKTTSPENIIPYKPKKNSDSVTFIQELDMIGAETDIRVKKKISQGGDLEIILGDEIKDLADSQSDDSGIILDSIPELADDRNDNKKNDVEGILKTEELLRNDVEKASDPLIDTIVADYKLSEIVDVTRFWKEYKGAHIFLDDTAIIRIMSDEYTNEPNFETRFRREAQVSIKLEHENIIRPRSSGKFKKTYYFLRDYKDTRRLEVMISKKGTIPYEIALIITRQLANALKYAHKRKVIHRNINPSNVLIDNKGKVFLYDFGFAAIVDQPSSGSTLSGGLFDPRALLYRAPELFHTTPYADEQSDIYSLCATIYFALTGYPPFANIGEITDNSQPISLSLIVNGLSEKFASVISRGLEKNPFKRYEFTQEFCDALEKISI